MITEVKPEPDAIRNQLKQIIHSRAFKATEKQRNFLRFVVNEVLAGRASQIKGYTIAVSVYGRSRKFDPQVDPIVRVEAGRLRRALHQYYLSAGNDDPIRFIIPKGTYVPQFKMVSDADTHRKHERRIRGRGSALARPSIMVMPLINLTGKPDQDYFVDGLTEEFTSELARYQSLRVIASQSSMHFKGSQADPQAIGRQLRVRFLLSGSVRMDTETVKVTVQLTDTSTNTNIWSHDYKCALNPSNLIKTQEKIVLNVVGIVADHYGFISRRLSLESHKKAPAQQKAYDAVLQFYNYENELTPQSFQTAMAALERAVEIAPDYGLAYSMLGHLHADNYALEFCEIEAPLEKALSFAQRGIALAPKNQFAADTLSLVYFHRGDKNAFFNHVETTIALNPNAPYIIGVAGWHMVMYGEWERGLTLLHKGMQLNPLHPTWFYLATWLDAYRRGDYDAAIMEADKVNLPGLYLDPMTRAATLGRLRQAEAAGKACAELLTLVPDFATCGADMIGRYVRVPALVDAVMEGLYLAGLDGGQNNP